MTVPKTAIPEPVQRGRNKEVKNVYKKTIPVKSSVAKVFSSSLEAYVVEPQVSPMPIVPPLPQVPVYTIEGSSSFRVKMAMTRTTLASALKKKLRQQFDGNTPTHICSEPSSYGFFYHLI